MNDWDKILDDFARKCKGGAPDMTNPRHLALLRESLIKFGWKEFATNEFIGNLREGEKSETKPKNARSLAGKELPPGAKRWTGPRSGEYYYFPEDGEPPEETSEADWDKLVKVSKKKKDKMKDLASREGELDDEDKEELRQIREEVDNEKTDVALRMTEKKYERLQKELKDLKAKEKKGALTDKDVERLKELEEAGIGAGVAGSQAGECMTKRALDMLKEGKSWEDIEKHLKGIVADKDHVLHKEDDDTGDGWVTAGIAAARKVDDELKKRGLKLEQVIWDTPEGRESVGVSTEFRTASDIFFLAKDSEGREVKIGASLKKSGLVFLNNGGWDTQFGIVKKGLAEAKGADGSPLLTPEQLKEFDEKCGVDSYHEEFSGHSKDGASNMQKDESDEHKADTHKFFTDDEYAERTMGTNFETYRLEMLGGIDKDLSKEIKGLQKKKKAGKLSEEEKVRLEELEKTDLHASEAGKNYKRYKELSEQGKLKPEEEEELEELKTQIFEEYQNGFLSRMQKGRKVVRGGQKQGDYYSNPDSKAYGRLVQNSNYHQKTRPEAYDNLRQCEHALTARTMDALRKNPDLAKAVKVHILNSIHVDDILGLNDPMVPDANGRAGVDQFMVIYGNTADDNDGASLNEETLTSLFGKKFKKKLNENLFEVRQAVKRGKKTKAEARGELKELIASDMRIDHDNHVINFKQEFPDPNNPGQIITPEYPLFDWHARAKGLGASPAMEIAQKQMMAKSLVMGTPDVNEWNKDQDKKFGKEKYDKGRKQHLNLLTGEITALNSEYKENETKFNMKPDSKVQEAIAKKRKKAMESKKNVEILQVQKDRNPDLTPKQKKKKIDKIIKKWDKRGIPDDRGQK